jgi:hypothetical protein
MNRATEALRPDISSDPFQERSCTTARRRVQILGAQFLFESSSRALLALVDSAYAGLPQHRFNGAGPRVHIKLAVTSSERRRTLRAPPPLSIGCGAGFLCGATAQSNFVVLSPAERSALVVVPQAMLRYPYHTRYELIEFAVFTLAARVQGLVPLHAACVGSAGRGLLLLGGSGAGKSTLALHCLLNGFDFVSEDSAFVALDSMRATGVANFLHVRADSLNFLESGADAAMIRHSPLIRRRSGIAKFELDLRHTNYALAAAPLTVDALIFISKAAAGTRPLLAPLSKSRVLTYLQASQPYARSLPQWRAFIKLAVMLDAFELRRARHPQEAVAALQELTGFQAR